MFLKISDNKKQLALLVLLGCFLFFSGFFIGDYHSLQDEEQDNKLVNKESGLRLSGYKFVNPLLECDIFNADMTPSSLLEKMKKEIGSRLKSPELVSGAAYFRDLNNGPWVGINEEEKFTPASLMKVPMMMAFFRNTEIDPAIAKKKIIYRSHKTLDQNIKDDYSFTEGKEYSLEELNRVMIVDSSNEAAEILLDNIDESIIQKIFHDFNIPDPAQGVTEDYMSVKTYSAFFRILYNASYLSRQNSEAALKLLSEATYKDGLVAGLPKGVPVAHKFGERKYITDGKEIEQLHDCGIVYAANRRYVLCVMTRGHDFDQLKSAIKDVSKIVYNDFVLENK